MMLRFFRRTTEELSTLAALPEHSPESPVSVHSLTVAYHERPVLWDVELDLPPGRLAAIVGPNGAGKSTLLKAALELIPKVSGTVEFWGQPLSSVRSRIAYVPQRSSVDWDFPISALEVVLMGRYGRLSWCQRPSKLDREKALHFLNEMGLAAYASRQISQLSGGQQQRVFLARALTQEADFYIMDEPFAGVDASTESAILTLLKKLQTEGKTVLCVHHDLVTVSDYFDFAVLLNCRVIAAGPMEEVFTDENLKKTYGGRLTLLDEVSEALARLSSGERPAKQEQGE